MAKEFSVPDPGSHGRSASRVAGRLLGPAADAMLGGVWQYRHRVLDSVQDTTNQAGQDMPRRNLNIQPTLTARPGLPVSIIVNRDIVLPPCQPGFLNRGTSP
jgi:type IV secretory pathway VirB10-like protein